MYFSGKSAKDVDVFQSSRLSSEETIRTSGLLYVSEFLSHFGKALSLKPLSFQELHTMIVEGELHKKERTALPLSGVLYVVVPSSRT